MKTEHWRHLGIAMRFSISLWGHKRVLSVKNLFWWTIMPVSTLHTALTPIWNIRHSLIWTGMRNHSTWIRLSMHMTFFSVGFQPDLCNPGIYRSSRMHWLLNGGWFHKTGYRLWLRASTKMSCYYKNVLMPVIKQVFNNELKTMWKFSLLESHVLRHILGVPRRSL